MNTFRRVTRTVALREEVVRYERVCKSNMTPPVGGLGLGQVKEVGRKRAVSLGCFVA